jgi:hypothetical protein
MLMMSFNKAAASGFWDGINYEFDIEYARLYNLFVTTQYNVIIR